MTALDLIRRLHEHRMWCNANLRRAAAGLDEAQLRHPFEMGQGSLWATLVHLYGAEDVWLRALEGDTNPPLAGPAAFDSLDALTAAWAQLDARWQRHLEALTEATLEAAVTKISGGRSYTTRRVDVLLHVCTHAQYTTAQAVHMLRRLGVTPLPDTMLITLARQASTTAPTQ